MKDPDTIQKLAHRLCVMKSSIHGFGCFAAIRFPKGGTIAEYAGEKITYREAQDCRRGREKNEADGEVV